MAVRRRLAIDDETRKRIQTSQLINRLTDHALGACDMTRTQVRAIEILLRKTLPDLTSVEIGGEDGGPIVVTWQTPS